MSSKSCDLPQFSTLRRITEEGESDSSIQPSLPKRNSRRCVTEPVTPSSFFSAANDSLLPLLRSLQRRDGRGDFSFVFPGSSCATLGGPASTILPNVLHLALFAPGYLARVDLSRFRVCVFLQELPDDFEAFDPELFQSLATACSELNSSKVSPPVTVVVFITRESHHDVDVDIPPVMQELFDWTLTNGADCVLLSCPTHHVTYRQLCVEVRSHEFWGERMAHAMEHTRAQCEQVWQRKFQVSLRKVIWQAPQKVFKHIPQVDPTIEERESGVRNYKFTKLLGRGGYGTVQLANHPQHGSVAIKVIQKNKIRGMEDLAAIENELSLLIGLLDHPNVLQIFKCLHGPSNLYIIMQYLGDYSLLAYIKLRQPRSRREPVVLPFDEVRGFFCDFLKALAHCHSRSVCHRDIKFANAMITNDGRVTLVDFGLSTWVVRDQPLHAPCGTVPFAAPEVLCTTAVGYNGFAADVWSLGVVLIELVLGLGYTEKAIGLTREDVDNFDHIKAQCENLAVQSTQKKLLDTLAADIQDVNHRGVAHAFRDVFQVDAKKRPSVVKLAELEVFFPHVGPLTFETFRRSVTSDLDKKAVPNFERTVCDRSAAIRQNSDHRAMPEGVPLLMAVGGKAILYKVVNSVYEWLLPRPEFQVFFLECPMKMGRIRAGMQTFLTQLLEDKGHCDLHELRNVHSHLSISDGLFNVFVDALRQGFHNEGTRGAAATELTRVFEYMREPITAGYRERVLEAHNNSTEQFYLTLSERLDADDLGEQLEDAISSDARLNHCPDLRLSLEVCQQFAKELCQGSLESATKGFIQSVPETARSALTLLCDNLGKVLVTSGLDIQEVNHILIRVEHVAEPQLAAQIRATQDPKGEHLDWFVRTMSRLMKSDSSLREYTDNEAGLTRCLQKVYEVAIAGREVSSTQVFKAHEKLDLPDSVFNDFLVHVDTVLQTLFPWPQYSASVNAGALRSLESLRACALSGNTIQRVKSYSRSTTLDTISDFGPGTQDTLPGFGRGRSGSKVSFRGQDTLPGFSRMHSSGLCPVSGASGSGRGCPVSDSSDIPSPFCQ